MASPPQGRWSAFELTDLVNKHLLLQAELGDGTVRSQTIQMGKLAGRFVGDMIGADQTGRKAFLMELDAPYADVIVDRFQRFAASQLSWNGQASRPFR